MADRILFNSRGHLGVVNADGTGQRFLEFDVPNQVSWGLGPAFSDGRRIIAMSVENPRTWEHQSVSHLWIHDLDTGGLTEIATKNKPCPFMPAAALLPGEEQMIVNPDIDGEQRAWIMDLDGSNPVELTRAGEGFTYGISLSPDARRIAFHAPSAGHNYRVFTMNLDGTGRTLVVGHIEHIYFCPLWSPDGEWLLFLDCHSPTDPGHDWAELCIARPDGRDFRHITTGMDHWFATSYGSPATRGSGSNIVRWSPRRNVCTYTRALPGSRSPWQYRPDRPDSDHFNRDYLPEEASGGTGIYLVDPFAGDRVTAVAPAEPGVWLFRATWSPDGSKMAYCRSAVGEPAELWVMDADGGNARFLTRGWDDMGADHPLWV